MLSLLFNTLDHSASHHSLTLAFWPYSLHVDQPLVGDRGRRRAKLVLYRRQKANGIVPSRNYRVKSSQNSAAIMNTQLHSISYTLSRNQAVIVEFAHDEDTDMFQVDYTADP